MPPLRTLALPLLSGVCMLFTGARAQDYWVLHSFNGADGDEPRTALIRSGDTVYGATEMGGCFQQGTLFKMNTDGSGFAVLHHFNFKDRKGGAYPQGSLVLSGQTLYGITYGGGSSGLGTIYSINTDGTGYTVLKNFAGSDGATPWWSGLTRYGPTLYGSTYAGGISNQGTIFQLNTDGSGYTVLKHFTGAGEGRNPVTELVLSGSNLYGTTSDYGDSGHYGSVFKLSTNGAAFTTLKSFQFSDGYQPFAGLALSGDTLFGTTEAGGANFRGTIFKLQTDGTGFTVMKDLDDTNGASPYSALVASGSALYGTTFAGGISNAGTIFKISPDGTDYVILKHFERADGEKPYAPLTVSGPAFFGTTSAGGPFGRGVIFLLALPASTPTILVGPRDQTVQSGETASFSVRAAGTPPLAYQWSYNGAPLAAATMSTLSLTNVQPAQAGSYSVFITNALGTASSPMTYLSVLTPGATPVATPTEPALRAALAGAGPVTFACDGTIILSSTIAVAKDTVIDGSGHDVTISGGGVLPLFVISTNATLTLRNVTLADGFSRDHGAAVFNAGGTLNVERCTFRNHITYPSPATSTTDGSHAYGGAIDNAGTLSVARSTFSNNCVSGGTGGVGQSNFSLPPGAGGKGGTAFGGAIRNSGSVVLDSCVFIGNTAIGGEGGHGGDGSMSAMFGVDQTGGRGGDGADAKGGALFNEGLATLINCTFTANHALGGNGGAGGHGGVQILSAHQGIGSPGGNGGNGAAGLGVICDATGRLQILNCTIAANTASPGTGGARGSGANGQPAGSAGSDGTACGGLNSPSAKLMNTLLTANSPAGNCCGPVIDLGHNLSSDASCAFTNTGSLNSTDPLLGPVSDNGGPTLTIPLLPGSPAIDGADTLEGPTSDQRGFPRPAGSAADIGAFEYGSMLPVLSIQRNGSGGLDIFVRSLPNQSCRLLSSLELRSWETLGSKQTAADGTAVFQVNWNAAEVSRYYRVVVP